MHDVIGDAPALDEHLRLVQRIKDLTGEQLVAQLASVTIVVATLLRAVRFDEHSVFTPSSSSHSRVNSSIIVSM